ncbi:hypothetical protein C8R48DRAFT_678469 [Suillus tomentosus]|nr:hypothetical protein C8R48DRAFT_678469 [Suillus tomentosus]
MGEMRAYGVKRGKVRARKARESAENGKHCGCPIRLVFFVQLSTSTPSYEKGAGSAHVCAREAYGRVNIGRVCAREREKTARICARSKCVISSLDSIIMRENENESALDETQGKTNGIL